MKFSYNWIREYVEGLDTPARDLERKLTVRTAECDGIEPVGELLERAQVVRVENVRAIAETHLVEAQVYAGGLGQVTVVCGAPNCRAGMRAIWVPIGVKTIHGVESNGMLASAEELGINRDHSGILEVQGDWPSLAPDFVIEIDNKSLTHRPDLWGHVGMAREVAAIVRKTLRDPVDLAELPSGGGGFAVTVEDAELCHRFSVLTFENVRIAPSPLWLQYRLTAIGLNPINNIVDLTNFVMAELAQPMHAFDRDKLRGDRLVVRAARPDEELLALNDEVYSLGPSHGVVADAEGAVSLAGIIGGKDSAIAKDTTRIVLESANWKAASIRKTSDSLRIRTDASMRFEKAQDPANTLRSLARAIVLMREVCPEARLVGGVVDIHGELPAVQTIELRLSTVARKLGREIPSAEVREILEHLAFSVTEIQPDVFHVTPPSWRATKDISMVDDLVEEIGRMIGYDTIEPRAPSVSCVPPPEEPMRGFLRTLRGLLTARGFTEVSNYSFLSDAEAERFGLSSTALVRVLNPIASDQNLLRSSLLPGLFRNLELNAKHFDRFRLFEIGREVHLRGESLPAEVPHVVAAVFASEGDGTAGLSEITRTAETLAPGCAVEPTVMVRAFEHPARTGLVRCAGEIIGRVFEAHPDWVTGRAAVLDLDLELVQRTRGKETRYRPLQRFPSSAFDLTLSGSERIAATTVREQLRGLSGELAEAVDYVGEYRSAEVGAGMKSITFRVSLSAPDRTLTSEETVALRQKVLEGMRNLGYQIKV